MLRWFATSLVLLLLPGLCPAADAVVLTVTGKAELRSASGAVPATVGARLTQGVALQCIDGSVGLLTVSGRVRTLAAGETYQPESPRAGDPGIPARLAAGVADLLAAGQQPTIHGMVRDPDSPDGILPALEPRYPRNSVVRPGSVRFEWSAPAGDAVLELLLSAPSETLRQTLRPSPAVTHTDWPTDAPPLTPGTRYYWKLRVSDPVAGESRETPLFWFEVLTEAQSVELDADLQALRRQHGTDSTDLALLEPALLATYGLYHDALRAIPAGPMSPEVESLKQALRIKLGLQGAPDS